LRSTGAALGSTAMGSACVALGDAVCSGCSHIEQTLAVRETGAPQCGQVRPFWAVC